MSGAWRLSIGTADLAVGRDELRGVVVRHLALITLAVVLAGCSSLPPAGSPGPTPSAPPGTSDALDLRAQPFADSTINAAVSVLARSGVATYETATAGAPIEPVAEPAVPLKLLRDQVRAMALEANKGGGIEGAELDELVETDPDMPPPSYVLAGYVAAVQTEGAALSRALIGEQDWRRAPSVVFPQLVLVLFTADLTRERMSEAASASTSSLDAFARGGQRPVGRPVAVAGGAVLAAATPCSDVSNFISGALKAVFDALRLGQASGTAGTIVVTIWNFIVGVLETVVRTLIEQFTQRVLDAIGRVAAIVGTVAIVVSAIRPWTLTITADPSSTEKGISGRRAPEAGKLVAAVDLGGFDKWPGWAEDCARTAGAPLPNLKPEGAPIIWRPVIQNPPALVAEGNKQATLDAEGRAELAFTTLVDTVEVPYSTVPGAIYARASIERQSLKDLATLFREQLYRELPSIVVGPLQAFLGPSIQKVVDSLGRLITVQASGPAVVLFHVQQQTPPPSPESPPPSPDDEGNKDEFCRRYRAMLDWAAQYVDTDFEATQPWAAEIARRSQDMRPFAPAHLVDDVDLYIRVYGTFATAPEPINVPIVGPDAAGIADAFMAMNAYCGIRP